MHRYEELEKLYYKKKYLKLFFRLIAFIIVASLLYFVYLFQFQQNIFKKNIEVNKSKQIIENNNTKKDDNKTIIVKSNDKSKKEISKIKKEKLFLYPIYPELNLENKEMNSSANYTKPVIKESNTSLNKDKNITQQKPKIHIGVSVKENKQTLQDYINVFNNSKDYDLAIKIATIYLNQKKYKKAIDWSKKANEIKPEDAKSWYIFAKSLIELGKQKEAKRVLIAYLNTYGTNEELEKLLRSIK